LLRSPLSFSHSVKVFLFAPRVCGVRALRVPTRDGPQLLRLRPSSAAGAGVPSVSTKDRVTDTPAPIRTLGTRSLRRDRRFTRGAEVRSPPPAIPWAEFGGPVSSLGEGVGAGPWRIGRVAVDPPRGPQGCRVSLWVGGINSAGAMSGRSLRSPRAPDERGGSGRRRRGSLRTPRGPDADRAPPVAGGGVCRRRARGRASLQAATVAPAKNKPLRSDKRKRAGDAKGHRRTSTQWKKESRSAGQKEPPPRSRKKRTRCGFSSPTSRPEARPRR
jgi:hypothetical protein